MMMIALLLLSILEDVDGLNLSSVRRALQTTGGGGGGGKQTRNVSYFKKDLPQPIMPLCGNGRLDKRDDYETYFANLGFGDVFHVPRRVITGGSGQGEEEVVGLKIVVDEVCDDGNRRDGDGCSADCLVRDKIDSSCEIAVRWPDNNNNATVN
jgi:cysteine-rich repeat protein